MNTKLGGIFSLVFFVSSSMAILWGFFWIWSNEKRLKRFFLGKKAKDLEDTIIALEDEIKKLNKARENAEKEIGVINSKLKRCIRGIETVRVNPFPDQGSNQSFAIGMLYGENDVVGISSLYSRERMII